MPSGFVMPSPTKPTLVPKSHGTVLDAVVQQYRNLLDDSGQAMYLFLDDHNKACNERFAKLLGYPNAAAWAATPGGFTQAFVDPASQATLVHAYQNAVQEGIGARVPVAWRRKDGSKVATQVLLVPADVQGHRVAVHFIDPA